MKNLLIAQSGGPTSAINATVAGIVEKAFVSNKVDKIYGAIYGIKGVIDENFVELQDTLSSTYNLNLLSRTPSAALGSCRFKLKCYEDDIPTYQKIIDIFKKHNIGYFIYIGGNDSMDTVAKLSRFIRENNIEDITVMGAPKTIDNDLCETDHCPGFGSAAKYIATTFAEIRRDCESYNIPAVTVVEVMGRNAGWLTASSALARVNGEAGPQLIYLCEKPFDVQGFISDVKKQLKTTNTVIVAVSEGIKDKDGNYIGEFGVNICHDSFGHAQLGGVANYLKAILISELKCKVRAIELSLMQRCASHIASETDITESKLLGVAAATEVLNGSSGKMVAVDRVSDKPYKIKISAKDINKIANFEKKVPDEWINESGNDVKQELIDYIYPLIQGEVYQKFVNGIPEFIRLK